MCGCSKVVLAFSWRECFDGFLQVALGWRGDLSEEGFEFGKAISFGLKSRLQGIKKPEFKASDFDSWCIAKALWVGRLSVTTISPDLSVGASVRST